MKMHNIILHKNYFDSILLNKFYVNVRLCIQVRYQGYATAWYGVWGRTSQQMSDEHDRHTTAIDLQLHRIWWRAESCDGCRMFDDDRDRGNIDFGDGDQDDNDGGGGKTDRDGRLMSEGETSRNSHVGYSGREKRRVKKPTKGKPRWCTAEKKECENYKKK